MEKPQILWVAHYYTKPLESVKTHTHPYYHMIYVMAGTLRFVVNDNTYRLTPGHSLLIPKNTNHAYYNDDTESAEYYEIKFSLLNSTLHKQIMRKEIQVKENELVGKLFEQIVKEYAACDHRTDDAVASYILALLNLITENERYQKKQQFRYFAASDYSELSQKVIRYLEDHYHEDVSLDSLAKAVNLNKSYLCVAFKKDTQSTILDCLNTIRIRRAAELVVYSDYNLAQVAEECGFTSVSHFNRVFLKYVGITPGQCRRAYPADAMVAKEIESPPLMENTFMYSVLAQKLITPQIVSKLDLSEAKTFPKTNT